MKKSNRIAIVCILSLLIAYPGIAQTVTNESAKAMLKFGWIIGRWQGDAWYMTGQNTRQSLKQTEMVQGKHKGTIIVMEGNAVDIETDPNNPRVVYETLGILNYDTATNKYYIHAFIDGRSIKSEAVPNKNHGFDWGFDIPSGRIKYSMGLNQDKNWKETGHISFDGGKTWVQNFEMVLTRVLREE